MGQVPCASISWLLDDKHASLLSCCGLDLEFIGLVKDSSFCTWSLKAIEFQIKWVSKQLNLKAIGNQVTWVLNLKPVKSQMIWQPDHLNLKPVDWISNQVRFKTVDVDFRTSWIPRLPLRWKLPPPSRAIDIGCQGPYFKMFFVLFLSFIRISPAGAQGCWRHLAPVLVFRAPGLVVHEPGEGRPVGGPSWGVCDGAGSAGRRSAYLSIVLYLVIYFLC